VIGVVARKGDEEVVREFFEFFKTPWEFYQGNREYDAILAPAALSPAPSPGALILFGSDFVPGVDDESIEVRKAKVSLMRRGNRLPLYGSCLLFGSGESDLRSSDGQGSALVQRHSERGNTWRLGYDFFEEIRFLLVKGQPEKNSRFPSLEQHVAVLRELLIDSDVSFAEVPPVPAGHPFSVCLTHDVDHPLLGKHKIDHTALGFLLRATVGSVVRTIRGELTVRELLKNLSAAVRLPFIQFGLAPDIWGNFDRYLEIEGGLASTFFFIPQRGCPGKNVSAKHARRRAAAYSLEDVRFQIDRIRKNGSEIAVHGIDAWTDFSSGRVERARVAEITGETRIGVRMHWLCFGESSPTLLEKAGFDYDSTVGYNATVGYRAGTLQAYRPLGTEHLMELPLHIMDTALFYPSYLNLRTSHAAKIMRRCFADALRFGGVLTLNWHDRSIAPERQWEGFYVAILEELKQLNPWFATALQAAAWFRVRRSVVFEEVRNNGRVVKVKAKITIPESERIGLPGLKLIVARRHAGGQVDTAERPLPLTEHDFRSDTEISMAA
jgi:hypothetical protein